MTVFILFYTTSLFSKQNLSKLY